MSVIDATGPSLRAQLDAACAEGLEANVRRWFDFAGARNGDVFEVAALKVPGRNNFKATWITRCTAPAMVIAALKSPPSDAPAFYTLVNAPVPEIVAQDGGRNRWFQTSKDGDGRASDRQIASRAALYIDVDPVRPGGLPISATLAEREAAWTRALDVVGTLEPLVGRESIGVGDSGNGTAIYVALDRLPETKELHGGVTSILKSLGALHSDAVVKIDSTVSNAARLHPLYGTKKRKGENTPERAHRPTGFLAWGSKRLVADELLAVVAKLRELAPIEEPKRPRASTSSSARSTATSTTKSDTPSPFDLANGVAIEDVARELGLADSGRVVCPRGCSGGSSVALLTNANVLKCSHATCENVGPKGGGVRTPVDLWAEVRSVEPLAAARAICEWRGIALPKASRSKKHLKLVDGSEPATPGPSTPANLEDAWRERITQGEEGPKSSLANATLILTHHLAWKDVLGYDERAEEPIFLVRPPFLDVPDELLVAPRAITDADDVRVVQWLEEREGISISTTQAHAAIHAIAATRPFDRVRDYLKGLAWDGKRRIDFWLQAYLGVEDSKYVRAVGRRWLVSAVARTFAPGSKVDHVLVLEGDQGIGKSTALGVLAGDEYFGDDIPAIGTKDAQQYLGSRWIVELAEMDAATRAESSTLKRFLTTTEDRYRPPYGRHTIRHARRCVFAGTVNLEEYLKDSTGGRRFWPVRCTVARIEELRVARDQLWAEAVAAYHAHESWHLGAELEEDASIEQQKRLESDPWETAIAKYLLRSSSKFVTTSELLEHAIGLEVAKQTKREKNRIGDVMRALKWTFGEGPHRMRGWRMPE